MDVPFKLATDSLCPRVSGWDSLIIAKDGKGNPVSAANL